MRIFSEFFRSSVHNHDAHRCMTQQRKILLLYCFKNYKKQGRYVQNQQKKSSSNINTLSNDPTSIIIYRKRRYEHVYDYNKVFHEF